MLWLLDGVSRAHAARVTREKRALRSAFSMRSRPARHGERFAVHGRQESRDSVCAIEPGGCRGCDALGRFVGARRYTCRCAHQLWNRRCRHRARRLSELWEDPHDIASRDLFNGPWGAQHAPDPHAVYTFVRPKQGGTNPGVVVRDPQGREWHVKQPPRRSAQGEEGPVEVVLSRVLSGLGYHQPPVYFLRSFTMADASETRIEPGGRFRLHEPWLKDRGSWSWQQNPFVNERPFNGLLVHPDDVQQHRSEELEQHAVRRRTR